MKTNNELMIKKAYIYWKKTEFQSFAFLHLLSNQIHKREELTKSITVGQQKKVTAVTFFRCPPVINIVA